MSSRKPQILFIVKFLALIITLYVVIALGPVDRHVVTPFSRFVTACSTSVLRVVGQPVQREGTIIRGDKFAVDVKNGCNGIEAILLVISAIAAFPATWRQRLVGMLIVSSLVQLVNVLRVASLYLIGKNYPALFDAAHVTVWQSVMFLISIGLFMGWSSRVARTAEASA